MYALRTGSLEIRGVVLVVLSVHIDWNYDPANSFVAVELRRSPDLETESYISLRKGIVRKRCAFSVMDIGEDEFREVPYKSS